MARARPGLAKAVHEILEQRGGGRRLSYRQAERLTGLSPATIGELAKGNARTSETVRRFALGMGVEPERLLLLSGFVPEECDRPLKRRDGDLETAPREPDADVQKMVALWSAALERLPDCRDRDLFLNRLRHDVELMERFVDRCGVPAKPERLERAGEQENREG